MLTILSVQNLRGPSFQHRGIRSARYQDGGDFILWVAQPSNPAIFVHKINTNTKMETLHVVAFKSVIRRGFPHTLPRHVR